MEEALAPHLGYLGRLRVPGPPASVCLGPAGCGAWQKEQHTWSWLAGKRGRGGQSAFQQGVLQGSGAVPACCALSSLHSELPRSSQARY